MRKSKLILATMMLTAGMLFTGCGSQENTTEVTEVTKTQIREEVSSETDNKDQVASADEMVEPEEVVEEGMEPVTGDNLKDGVYDVTVKSSSSMFTGSVP